MDRTKRVAIIIGAGPAGLTAALELTRQGDIVPVVYEQSDCVGGISRTVNHRGNRIDIGGHRFFSKSSAVMDWWRQILPLQRAPAADELDLEDSRWHGVETGPPDPEQTDRVMLIRRRRSRILHGHKFFDYPLALNFQTLARLGVWKTSRIAASAIWSHLAPVRPEKTLEDFFVNRFGAELYTTFFKDYTEKVWGVPCRLIGREWGQQRVRGLSIARTVWDALKHSVAVFSSRAGTAADTSLIREFWYPKFGPGQLWEEAARLAVEGGAELHLGHTVVGVDAAAGAVRSVTVREERTGRIFPVAGDYFLSSMPVRDLVAGFGERAPATVRDVAAGLCYRDFLTVGLLVRRLLAPGGAKTGAGSGLIPDNWVYIQEKDVRLGRLQVFNNWSPYMVADRDTVWLGLEYFCAEGDELWRMPDGELATLAAGELAAIGLVREEDVLDAVVIRMPKAYPAYFGTYERFETIRHFTDSFRNLCLIGRNGMHRYNNQDHSMLTAMAAVRNILRDEAVKDSIWDVNADEEYHEES